MNYICDVCDKRQATIVKETGSGIIRVCNWCENSSALCPLGCKHKDIKCIDCVDLSKYKRR